MLASTQYRMMVWTMVIVVFVGTATALTLLQPPKTIRLEDRADRGPASLGPSLVSSFAIKAVDRQALDAELGCEAQIKFAGNVVQVRLTGTPCVSTQEITRSEISNETNGFSATVFASDARHFTTDYISLSPGENRLRVALYFKSGDPEIRSVILNRSN